MKAIVQERYGSPDVLGLQEIDMPSIEDDEVLVRVRATSVHADVWHVMRGVPYVLRIMGSGLRKPKNPVPGTDLAGHVESVGNKVTRFRQGDEVFGQSLGANLWRNGGTFAEYAAAPEAGLELKPANLTFEEAAAVLTSGPIAVQGLRDEGRIQAGQKVLINGAGGAVGTLAVQIAKAFGAGRDRRGQHRQARHGPVDRRGPGRRLHAGGLHPERGALRPHPRHPGNHPWSDLRRALTPEGTYVLIAHDQYGRRGRRWIGSLGRFATLLVLSPFVSQLPGLRGANGPGDRLVVVKELIEAGKITPIIDRTFPLSEVPDAIRYLESGQAQGKVVITV